ncbi:MAG TPA: CHAD domain-containing protein [Acidimicrobiia bacterium]|nr:CHAD domain-containing protein [Acidimicrobiia bacterium]
MGERARRARAGTVVHEAIAGSIERFRAHEPDVLAGHDPEAVHQARVATRRLRSDLRTFRPFLEREPAGELRAELRWLGAELGAVRDAEVLTERLRRHVAGVPADHRLALEPVFARLERRWIDARADLLETLHSARHEALGERLARWHADPPRRGRADRRARDVLPPLVERPWGKLAAAVRALGPEPADVDLHAVRILAKRTRYAAEAIAPVAGARMRHLGRRLADLQDVLGEHQDAVVAHAWLAKVAADADAEVAFAAGMLAAVEHTSAHRARAEFPRAWTRARRAHRDLR